MTTTTIHSDIPAPFGKTLRVCRRHKSILLVALSRVKRFNAFNDDVYEDLISIMSVVEHDDSLSALVLTGSGPYFSSGADLSSGDFHPSVSGRRTRHKPAGRFMLAILRFPKVLAAAVNGPAVGIAVTLLLHCDLVHLNTATTLWAPFTRLALVPELCSSVTFPECMGLSKANEMLLLGKKIDAETALSWNICSKVVRATDRTSDAEDPFHASSLGSRMCNEIDRKLLSLPLGNKTAEYFVSFIKGSRRTRLEQVCLAELLKLDERFDSGQVSQAASYLKIGSKRKTQSKL